jgi:AraC-like DNA-binding protein
VVSPLLHQLLLSCADLPALYDEQGRDSALVQLVLHEVASARSLPLFAPIPRDEKLAALCKPFLAQPSIRATPQDWAQALNKSLRTFSRFFQQQTGMAFGAWRQQACLLAAVSRLSSGASVTEVAMELGYDSPSAFSTMFRKALGRVPSELGSKGMVLP